MNMADQMELPFDKDLVWQALNDLVLLKLCIPGCESIDVKDDGACELLVRASVCPVNARFKGLMRMKDVVPLDSYTLEFSAQGGAVGYCPGQAQVTLVAAQPDRTVLRYTASANLGGKLVQVGARLIDMAAQKMAADFFAAFMAELGKRHAPAEAAGDPRTAGADGVADQPPRYTPPGGIWARMVAWWIRLVGGGRS